MTAAELLKRKCVNLPKGSPALTGDALAALRAAVPAWQVAGRKLERTFKFPDYQGALAFLNRVAALADGEDHHPELLLTWGKVHVATWTHTADGLSDNDFILAAKIDAL